MCLVTNPLLQHDKKRGAMSKVIWHERCHQIISLLLLLFFSLQLDSDRLTFGYGT